MAVIEFVADRSGKTRCNRLIGTVVCLTLGMSSAQPILAGTMRFLKIMQTAPSDPALNLSALRLATQARKS